MPAVAEYDRAKAPVPSQVFQMEILLAVLASSVFAMASFLIGLYVGAHYRRQQPQDRHVHRAETRFMPEMLEILSSPDLVMTKTGKLIHLRSVACRWTKDKVDLEQLKMCSYCFPDSSKVK